MSPGTNVKVKVLRDGKPQEFAITLAELPSKPESAGATSNGEPSPHLGISVEALTSDIARQLTLPAGTTGVVVSDVESGSVADEAGVRSGDVIQQVNRKPVDRPDAFAASIRQAGNQPVLLLIDRGGEHRYLVLTPR
jgi:S1-C subfamily serine protease